MWYKDLSDEYKEKFWCSKLGGNKTNTKPSFSNISKAKACILAKTSRSSSKAKVQPSESKAKASGSKAKSSGSKAKASPKTIIVKSLVPITNFVLGLENAKTWDGILNKTFGWLLQKRRKGRGRWEVSFDMLASICKFHTHFAYAFAAAFAACILQLAFATICRLHFQLAFATIWKHLQVTFAACIYSLHLHLHLQLAFASVFAACIYISFT
ncbi:hypothetical protein Tco_1442562 [Tanacetum coccineum]